MSDTSRPYMANSYFGAMRTPRTSKAGPHSEGKKPYHAGDYLEMELYDITDIPPYIDSPLTWPPSTPPPSEPPTLEGEDPCSKGNRVYWLRASPTSISGCNGSISQAFSLVISPDFKCPALFYLPSLSSGPEVRFNDQAMIVGGIAQRFPLYTKEATEDGEEVKSAGGTITIDFETCGNHAPWMTLAVAEECPCPGDPLTYSTVSIFLDQCTSNCSTCADPDCDDCPLTLTGGPTGGRAALSTSYGYTLTGAVGNVVWTTNNAGTTLSGGSSSGVTLNVLSTACNYNNGAITLTATDTRGENVCTKTKSAQAGTWVVMTDETWDQTTCTAGSCQGNQWPCSTGNWCNYGPFDATPLYYERYLYAFCKVNCHPDCISQCYGGNWCVPLPGTPTVPCASAACAPSLSCMQVVAYKKITYQWKCP